MGYFRYTLRCNACNHEWATFFCSVDMTSGAHDCPKCGTVKGTTDENDEEVIVKVADAWKYKKTDGSDEEFWH